MSRIGDNCRWIVSTEGDCLFAFKLDGKMWIKIYDTVRANFKPKLGRWAWKQIYQMH